MSLPTYNSGGQANEVETYWFSGTDTLQAGYNLCFDVAASPTATDPRDRLGNIVIKPSTASLNAYAGVVAPQSGGKTGPCFVDVITPKAGRFTTAYCNANATAFSTALKPQDASYALAAHSDSTLNLPMMGLAAETADTSSTAANKVIKFL